MTVSNVESWNKFRTKQKICCYLKIYPLIRLKQLSVILILNHINNSLIMQIICMTLLVHKHLEELFQLLITHAKFLFTAKFVVI